jgi:hypothetical protein
MTKRLFHAVMSACCALVVSVGTTGCSVNAPTSIQPDPRPIDHAGKNAMACSKFGHGCVTGAVRIGPQGLEVQAPSGTWHNCRGDCRDELRKVTVDVWETLQDQTNRRS